MQENGLTFPYRRYSSDIYAAQLCELLAENEIPFEVIGEPPGAGTVLLGSATLPGVIVMVREYDAHRIKELEGELTPQLHEVKPGSQEEEAVEPYWFILGYLFALLGAPIAIIAGLHLFSAKRRNPDFTSRYAYNQAARTQGKLIFTFALSILVFSFGNFFSGRRMDFLDTISFAIWQLNHSL